MHGQTTSPPATATLRKHVRERVKGCTDCRLHGQCEGPVPFVGRLGARYLFVGDRPSSHEDASGKAWSDGHARTVQDGMRSRGVFSREMAYTYAVHCTESKTTKKGGLKRPSPGELAACRVNLELELAAIKPKVMVLVGSTALSVFRPDLLITHHHSIPFVLPTGVVVVGITHPSAVKKNWDAETMFEKDLDMVKALGKAPMEKILASFPDRCVMCGKDAEYADDYGVFYCVTHEHLRMAWMGTTGAQLHLL